MKNTFLKRSVYLVLVLAIFLTICYLFVPSFSRKKVLVKIPNGASLEEVTRILQQKKVIENPYFFSFLVRVLNQDTNLKAGVYEFTSPTLFSTLEKLRKGKVKLFKVTIPEGLPKWQVASLLAEKGIVEEDKFLDTVDNPEILHSKFPWFKEESLEGYLFPDTYYFTLGENPVRVAEEFLTKFEQNVLPLFQENKEHAPFSLHHTVTLGSIIEKEAKVDSEKPIIAGVFYNRMRLGMKLRADPTIKYALGSFAIQLSKKSLGYPSPYNTYVHPGFPPGPICSPGKGSIKAAIFPAEVDYLYFVARGDGTHKFSSTYRDHLKAIRIYQRG